MTQTLRCFSRICSCISRGSCVPRLGGPVLRVQEEDGARRGRLEHVVAVEERLLVARDEVRAPHEVRRADRPRPEAQVRDGDGARLLRVVDEVALREVVRLLADDLDRVLVRADGAVGAEAVEEGAHRVGRLDVELRVPGKRRVRHVVHDADREVVLRLRLRELVEDGLHHAGRELLGREAVAAADDERLGGEGKTRRRAALRRARSRRRDRADRRSRPAPSSGRGRRATSRSSGAPRRRPGTSNGR